MTFGYKFSNNTGRAINLFIPSGFYYRVNFSCPDSNSMGVESYHPKNQQVFFGSKKELLFDCEKSGVIGYDAEKSIFFSGESGTTIVFNPEGDNKVAKSNFFHGYYTIEGFYESEQRKTRDITENFTSFPPLY